MTGSHNSRMESILIFTPSNIVFVIGIIGTIFGVYKHFKDPQISSDMADALINQQMKFFADSNEKRFNDIQENFKQLLLQSNNHIHTVDTKVDKLHTSVGEMGKSVVRLGTIIEERIPRK